MTYAPWQLLTVRAYLKPLTGLPDKDLGIIGDTVNHDGGYHCGWDRRRIVDGVLRDYSWLESPRDSSHKTDAASAFDIGWFPRLRELSIWIAQECAAGAPDTLDIREIIYSPDGLVVKRWDRLGKRISGDSSHLKHSHLSYFRDAEDRDKTALFRRFFEGTDDTMFTQYGEKGPKVEAYQRLLLAVDPACLPIWGPDGGFGDETAAAGAKMLGGDGHAYGPAQYAALMVKVGSLAAGTPALVPHTHQVGIQFGPTTATGNTGPAVTA